MRRAVDRRTAPGLVVRNMEGLSAEVFEHICPIPLRVGTLVVSRQEPSIIEREAAVAAKQPRRLVVLQERLETLAQRASVRSARWSAHGSGPDRVRSAALFSGDENWAENHSEPVGNAHDVGAVGGPVCGPATVGRVLSAAPANGP
jgi:hypothetical protein